jgi:hypothetical protein
MAYHSYTRPSYNTQYLVKVLSKGYDGERNFESLFDIYVLPNIKQRKNTKKGKNRKKAAKIFNASIYHYRATELYALHVIHADVDLG